MSHTSSTNWRKALSNILKTRALLIFEKYGSLNPPAWAMLAKFQPVRGSYSYLLRLHRFGLLNRTRDQSGLLLYSLSDRGRKRLQWLMIPNGPSPIPKQPKPNERRQQVTKGSQMRSNESVDKRLLNVREAARYLGLQADTVYKKARLRELPSVKVGRALRFDVVALNRYVEQHTIETIE